MNWASLHSGIRFSPAQHWRTKVMHRPDTLSMSFWSMKGVCVAGRLDRHTHGLDEEERFGITSIWMLSLTVL